MNLSPSEIRLAARSLAKAPGFFVSAVLVLALAIGASAAVFALVDAVLLQPLPFPEPDRLVVVWEKGKWNDRNTTSPLNYFAWKERSRSFAALEAIYPGDRVTLGGDAEPERVRASYVSSGLLAALRVPVAAGRGFAPEENLKDRRRGVALISAELFQRRFGADPAAIGGPIEIDGTTRRIVGVLPAGFRLFTPVDVILPLGLGPEARTWSGRYLTVIARLAPGASAASAQTEMVALHARLAAENPQADAEWSVNVVPLREQLVGHVRPALLVLFAAVGLVLVIACTNVAGLVLARTARRRQEIGVRLALGASGGRLFAQLALETAIVAAAGGLLALLLASGALRLALAAAPEAVPSIALSARLSPRVLSFTLAAVGLTALVTALAAALAARRGDVVQMLKRGTASPKHALVRSGLVVAQTALSVVLLVGAGLLVRSVRSLLAVDPGFAPDRAATLTLDLPRARYDAPEKTAAFLSALVERVSALPGVTAAGTVTTLPFDGLGSATDFKIEGAPEPPPGHEPVGDVRAVSGAYFRAMDIPLLAGSDFPAAAPARGALVPFVVNRTLARQLFAGGDAIGKRLFVDINEGLRGEIVGVVGDVRSRLDAPPRATLYWDARSSPTGGFSLVARSAGEPAAIAPALAREARALDPGIAASLRPMRDIVGASLGTQRSLALLVAAFSATALLLTAVGLYGIVAYLVAQRTQEIGVRIALGATPRGVAGFVLKGGSRLVLAGAAAGLALAFALAPLASRLLFGVAPRDPLTFAAVPAVLAAVALLACAVPAVRASRVDPIVALRAE